MIGCVDETTTQSTTQADCPIRLGIDKEPIAPGCSDPLHYPATLHANLASVRHTMKYRFYLGIELPVLERLASESKFDWVYRCVRTRICEGTLRPGVRIPSTRDLARQWSVSRGIVDAAYDALRQEGYLESRVGSGTWVCEVLPERFVTPAPAHPVNGSVQARETRAPHLRQAPARLADPRLFPLRAWREAVQRSMKRLSPDTLFSEEAAGHRGLREQIAMHLGATRGIHCSSDDILVTLGIRHGIELAAMVAAPGRNVFIEDPGYPAAYAAFRRHARQITPVAVDLDGIRSDRFCTSARPAVAYVTPAHQSPLGVALSPSRRTALLAWAAASDSYIVEDDTGSEMHYTQAPLPALKAQDVHDRVIFCSSFNKTLLSGLRIGFMVIPRQLRTQFTQRLAASGMSSGVFDQIVLHELLASGDFARHLRRVRGIYLQRRDLLLAALRSALGKNLSTTGEQAGAHFVLWLPRRMDAHALMAHLEPSKPHVQYICDFSHQHYTPDRGLMLGFAAMDGERLHTTAHQLERLLA